MTHDIAIGSGKSAFICVHLWLRFFLCVFAPLRFTTVGGFETRSYKVPPK